MKMFCLTLFDIEQTGINVNRRPPPDVDIIAWNKKRNSQCNFDSIVQVISMRSQPDVISPPVKLEIPENHPFGFCYDIDNLKYMWRFEFEVHHAGVFENGIIEHGALYNDCDDVPMLSENFKFLNTSPELKNIHFEEIHA